MPGAVDEQLPEPGRGEVLACGGIDLADRDPRSDGLACQALRLLQHRVRLGDLGGGLAHRVGPGAVGVIAAGQRPADVHHHDVPGLDHPVGHPVVRVGAVRARADDHELGAREPLGLDGGGDELAHLRLGPAHLQELPHPGMHCIDATGGLGELAHLVRGLHGPHVVDHLRGEDHLAVDPVLERHQVQRRQGGGHRHPPGDRPGDERDGVGPVRPRVDPRAHAVGGSPGDVGEFERRQHQQWLCPVHGHDQRGEPLVRVHALTGEVGHVLAGVHDHVVDPEVPRAIADGCQTVRVDLRGGAVHVLHSRPGPQWAGAD